MSNIGVEWFWHYRHFNDGDVRLQFIVDDPDNPHATIFTPQAAKKMAEDIMKGLENGKV